MWLLGKIWETGLDVWGIIFVSIIAILILITIGYCFYWIGLAVYKINTRYPAEMTTTEGDCKGDCIPAKNVQFMSGED